MKSHVSQTSRFLMQATLGASPALINQVANQGILPWLQQQLTLPLVDTKTYESSCRQIWGHFRSNLLSTHGSSAINGDGNNPALPYKWYFHMAWWQQTLGSDQHLVRQRVAQALSELLVISDSAALELDAIGLANYYDLLYNNAFSSYADLLYQVSLHPCMGVYLSHMNNRKADTTNNTHPDENYAREIMQLFSIGLYELNMDGSEKKDNQGNRIPSYNNRDIKQIAKVFTGLKADSYQYEWNTPFWNESFNGFSVEFEDGVDNTYKTVPFVNMTKPMQIDENFHDKSEKSLLNGRVKLRQGLTGKQDIKQLVDQLVAHPNTAPFVAKHMIKQLVTSNPSAHFIKTVAQKFGQRGNLKAMIETLFSYATQYPVGSTAANSIQASSVKSQKLKSPLLRVTQLLRAFNVSNRSKKLWLLGDDIQDVLQQHPLSSPTVFNFYKSDYAPHGPIEMAKLVAPEFELHTSATAIGYINMMYAWFFGNFYPVVSTQISSDAGIFNTPDMNPDRLYARQQDKLRVDFSSQLVAAKNPKYHDALIDDMSVLLTGRKNLVIKPQIKKAFQPYSDNPLWVVQTIAFMLAISADFTVQENL